MNFLKTMSVQESTLYKNWKQWNYDEYGMTQKGALIDLAQKQLWMPKDINDLEGTFEEIKRIRPIAVPVKQGDARSNDAWSVTRRLIHTMEFTANPGRKIKFNVKDEVTDGIVYNPILNEFYWASLGKGAWCNNKRIRVSKRQDFTSCLIGTGTPYAGKIYENYYKELNNISKSSAGIRRLGAASIDLAYVASGKIDGFWQKDLNLWDVSSGVILVKEAGGRLSEPNGKNWTTKSKDILASNTLIHSKLIENLTLL